MKIRSIGFPLIVIGALQLVSCTSGTTTVVPGGTYISASAGAHFDQAVERTEGDGTIATLSLKRSHRPVFAPQNIYVAASDAGIVVSKDGGKSWQVIAAPLTAVSDVVALENGVIVIAGADLSGQGFVMRTIDEGKSWETVLTIPTPVKPQKIELFGSEPAQASVVISIAPDPFQEDRIYAGTSLGNILVGTNSGKTWETEYTLKSSNIYTPDQQQFAIHDIIPSPHTRDEIMVILNSGKLFRINNDTQEELVVPIRQTSDSPFAFSTGNRTVRNVAYVSEFPNALFVGVDNGAVLSRDRGATWQELALPVDTVQDFNTVVVTASPTNSARLFVGINSVLYRSEDAGQTWSTFSFGLKTHGITSILIDPSNAANVVVVTSPIGV